MPFCGAPCCPLVGAIAVPWRPVGHPDTQRPGLPTSTAEQRAMSAPASARAVLGRGMRAAQATETGHQAAKSFFVEVRGSGCGKGLAAP